jgi:hypothetical protein
MSVVCEEAPGSPIVEKSVSTPRRVPQLQVSVGGESEDWQDVEQQYEYSFPANIINSNSGGDSPLSPGVQDEFGFIQYTSMELAQNRPKPKEAKVQCS